MLLKDKRIREDRTSGLLAVSDTSMADTRSFPTCPAGVSVRQCSCNGPSFGAETKKRVSSYKPEKT